MYSTLIYVTSFRFTAIALFGSKDCGALSKTAKDGYFSRSIDRRLMLFITVTSTVYYSITIMKSLGDILEFKLIFVPLLL